MLQSEYWRSVAVQAVSEAENCHGVRFILLVDARVRMQEPLQICQGCRSNSKNRDKQLTHIVRVIGRCYCFMDKKSQV
jgi:hypothetical protein